MDDRSSFWTDADVGALVLRVTTGVLLFFHGWHKVLAGVENQMQLLVDHGIPGFFMYFGYISEVVAPVLIVLGIFTRISILTIVVTMIVVFYVAPFPLWALHERTGAWVIEVQLFFFLIPVAMFFIGPGRFRVWRSKSGNWLLD